MIYCLKPRHFFRMKGTSLVIMPGQQHSLGWPRVHRTHRTHLAIENAWNLIEIMLKF